ncbi:MAG: DUF928 domain-containing protein [Phormidium sp. BM_Day4_Bin.17]|nr:DUF928 domain-containing protein [Phormidium sp. BM_Day4_Bin.17]UCJ12224.1 MAG: DUF928 domain-containing protein [Phormidium sp. PBR-2020]
MKRLNKILAITMGTASLVLGQAVLSTSSSLFPRAETTSGRAMVNASPITYVPPNRGRPQQTQGTGSRGCEAISEEKGDAIEVTLVTPTNHTAYTVSERPVFYWLAGHTVNRPVEFTLVEDGNPNPIYVRRLDRLEAGMNQVVIDSEQALEVGKTYRWTVSVICNPQRRSADIFAQGWVERVAISDELQSQLDSATTPEEIAQAYAGSGIWLDALAHLSSDSDRLEAFEAELENSAILSEQDETTVQN